MTTHSGIVGGLAWGRSSFGPRLRLPFSRAIRTGLAGLFVAVELTGCAAPNLTPPVHGTFTPTGSTTSARPSHTATLLPDRRVLVIGVALKFPGRTPSAELYDPETGGFSDAGAMTIAREGQDATLLPDGRVLIVGGQDGRGLRPVKGSSVGSGSILASAELYQP